MSDHDIIPPVSVDASNSLQQRNHNKQKDKKKKQQQDTGHLRTEPRALKDQTITTTPDSDHFIDYEA